MDEQTFSLRFEGWDDFEEVVANDMEEALDIFLVAEVGALEWGVIESACGATFYFEVPEPTFIITSRE